MKTPKEKFSCDLCESRFAYKSNLNLHKSLIHQKGFVCQLCDKSFKEEGDLILFPCRPSFIWVKISSKSNQRYIVELFSTKKCFYRFLNLSLNELAFLRRGCDGFRNRIKD